MKRSKGFTLIELLAVIVILAVIALIAVPQVLKILNKARLSAAEDTTYGIVKSAENYVTEFMLQNNGAFPNEELEFKCENKKCELQNAPENFNIEDLTNLDFKGTKPTGGVVTISNNGKTVVATNLIINGFTCNYPVDGKAKCNGDGVGSDNTEKIPEKNVGYTIEVADSSKTYKAIVYLDPTDLTTTCNASNSVVGATGTKEGCMKWYAYAETDTTYDLILDHNTTAKSYSFSFVQEQVVTDTANWDSGLNARNIKADEIATITGHPTFKQATAAASGWYYFDGNSQAQTSKTQGASNYTWLYDYTYNCTSYGCNNADSSTYGYWTQDMVAGSSSLAWLVTFYGDLHSTTVSITNYGVRPVITIQK